MKLTLYPLFGVLTLGALTAQPLTYHNRPQGSLDKPLLLRTFMPDPGLGDAVLARHQDGEKSPRYSPKFGKDVEGEYLPIEGLPAAIGVSYGPTFSYCWDTVECRLMYVWKNGFLDMTPYWGDPKRGNRVSFGYVPKLVGTMIYQASGEHPLEINGKSLSKIAQPLKFKGYTVKEGQYTFIYQIGENKIATTVSQAEGKLKFTVHYKILEGKGALYYNKAGVKTDSKVTTSKDLAVTIQGRETKQYKGVEQDKLLAADVNVSSGEKVFETMGCIMCHSIDGSKSHGPSLLGIHGSTRYIKGKKITADDSYIFESIRDPNAKVVEGYPKNYMPPYQLEKNQTAALILYLKSLKKN